MNATDARNKAVSSTWYLGAAQIFGTGATYLLLASLTSMGAEQYGLWVLVLLAVSYLSPWAGLGLGSGLVRYLPGVGAGPDRHARLRLIRRTCWGGALALAAALIIAAETLATAWFGGPENALLVWLIAVLFPLEAQLLIGNSYFQALERLGTYAALSAGRHLLELVLLSVLILACGKTETGAGPAADNNPGAANPAPPAAPPRRTLLLTLLCRRRTRRSR